MRRWCYIMTMLAILYGCSAGKKLMKLSAEQISAAVVLPEGAVMPILEASDTVRAEKTIAVPVELENILGDRILANAVQDELSGEMIMNETLNSIVVEARFRNIAERCGYVDIAFDIIVPPAMQHSEWQVEFQPELYVLKDTINLDKLLITGEKYRAAQMRGYELYNKFLSSIIPDTADFVDNYTYLKLLDIFIKRNIATCGISGVSEQDAVEHYTKQYLVERNNRRIRKKGKMYNKYIKVPILKNGIRLDTTIHNSDGTISYSYIQTIQATKGMKSVDMVLSGQILKEGKRIYSMPQTEPLTFYISSMSTLAETAPRYIKKIIHRNAVANTAAYIDFKSGQYNIDDTLSNNASEIGRIKGNIRDILQLPEYIVDSLVVTASCSPEGSYGANVVLADNRARSIKKYFSEFIEYCRDSIKNSIWNIGEDENLPDNLQNENIGIKTVSVPEEWERLRRLINNDTTVREHEKIARLFAVEDLDLREKALQMVEDYKYIRTVLYPLLRTVKFDFYLHRKGMIKDTVHTTELDAKYMLGLKALEERNYREAATLLYEYADYNTALAFVCMDYNVPALQILETLPKSAKRDYLRAVVYSRLDTEKQALEAFINAVEQDYAMRHRGNLDPEISTLIKKCNIDNLLDNI